VLGAAAAVSCFSAALTIPLAAELAMRTEYVSFVKSVSKPASALFNQARALTLVAEGIVAVFALPPSTVTTIVISPVAIENSYEGFVGKTIWSGSALLAGKSLNCCL
jgi:hypothetical protein